MKESKKVNLKTNKEMKDLRKYIELKFLNMQMKQINVQIYHQKQLHLNEVNDVKYIGKIDFDTKNVDGTNIPVRKNVYKVEETIHKNENGIQETKQLEVYYIIKEEGTFEAIASKEIGVAYEIVAKDVLGLKKEEIQEKLERLKQDNEEISLNDMDKETIEEVSKTLNIPKEELEKKYNILELDTKQEIGKKQTNKKELTEKETESIITGSGSKGTIDLTETIDNKRTIGEILGLDEDDKLVMVDRNSQEIQKNTKDKDNNQADISFIAIDKKGKGRIVDNVFEKPKSSNINERKESIDVQTSGQVKLSEPENTITILKIKGQNSYLRLDRANDAKRKY